MARHSQKTKMKVCYMCGDRGFSNALLYCSVCPNTAAHQYCLGITPGSINDGFSWECEHCCMPTESQPRTSMKPGSASTKRSEETCAEDMKEVEFKMRNINSLYPKSFVHKRKRTKRNRKRERSGSNCKRNNKVIMRKDCYTNTKANDNMEIVPTEEQPEPLLVLLPIEYQGSSEHADTSYGSLRTVSASTSLDSEEESEEPVSSLMECPEEIMRDLVLLVSPSGEIHIEPVSLFL